ncbi:hypothetical protein TSUD_59740 [Trifolium subterraneum]|uniref:Uncharacterized protein n=1 Tax=Trifolium subterraneum TaxID=3900 RepID=A0A2Z6N2C9_TRISU|nr:hypothetical protein TSUD_59740 [Trifolium subterraneum]
MINKTNFFIPFTNFQLLLNGSKPQRDSTTTICNEKCYEKKDKERDDEGHDAGCEEGEKRSGYGFDGFIEFNGSIKEGVEDAIGDGDDDAVAKNGRKNYEKERHGDNCGGVGGRLLLFKVFENELGEEGEKREG